MKAEGTALWMETEDTQNSGGWWRLHLINHCKGRSYTHFVQEEIFRWKSLWEVWAHQEDQGPSQTVCLPTSDSSKLKAENLTFWCIRLCNFWHLWDLLPQVVRKTRGKFCCCYCSLGLCQTFYNILGPGILLILRVFTRQLLTFSVTWAFLCSLTKRTWRMFREKWTLYACSSQVRNNK